MYDNWYAVQVRTGQEEKIVEACQLLVNQHALEECFIPKYKRMKKYKGKWHQIDAILFTGYVFMISDHIDELFNELKKWVDISSININIYLGNEVYITEDYLSLSKEISTINNSRYILIELPLNTKYNLIFESLNKLKKKNLIPIIAHPERYMAYYEDYDFFNNLRKIGCLLQGNIGSIYGNYGKKSKKMIIYMLENNMLDFLASDIHHSNNIIYDKDIKRDIFKIVKDKEVVEKLLNTNAEKVLNDIDIVEWSKNNE